MVSLKTKIASAALVSILVLGSLVTPVFANNPWNFDFRSNFTSNTDWEEFFNNFFRRKLEASLDGTQEVPGPGDSDGSGEAKVKIRLSKNELCVDMEIENIDSATAAHIHHAPAEAAGAVVVVLPIPDVQGEAEDCLEVNNDLLKKIKEEPEEYYINVHNLAYPNGAIRGQLSR